MNRFIVVALGIPFFTYCQIQMTLKQEWKRVDSAHTATRYKSLWLLACTIEFKKKKTDQSLFLEKLLISWKGIQLEHLHGSLYKKHFDNEFFPLQEHLLCESSWNRQKQQIIFRFERPLVLEAETTLCLVFSVPQQIESTLKNGYFEFERNTFPAILQESLIHKTLTFAYR